MIARGSRYETVPTGIYHDPVGREIPYLLLRRLPDPALQQTHVVAENDRLDLLAHRFYGDPEQFWRICDANRALWPDDLLAAPGRRLRIPFAER